MEMKTKYLDLLGRVIEDVTVTCSNCNESWKETKQDLDPIHVIGIKTTICHECYKYHHDNIFEDVDWSYEQDDRYKEWFVFDKRKEPILMGEYQLALFIGTYKRF